MANCSHCNNLSTQLTPCEDCANVGHKTGWMDCPACCGTMAPAISTGCTAVSQRELVMVK